MVPSTYGARLSDEAVNLLYNTPAAELAAKSLVLIRPEGNVKLTVTKVRSGPPENTLWEFRFDPGLPYEAGSWIIFRDGLDRIREVRIIVFSSQEKGDNKLATTGTWVRLSPVRGRPGSRMDLFLSGRMVWGSWEIPIAIDEIPKLPERDLWSQSESEVDWLALTPRPRPEDEKVEALVESLSRGLKNVRSSAYGLWNSKGWSALPGLENKNHGLGPWGVSYLFAQGIYNAWKIPVPEVKDLLVSRVSSPGYSKALDRGPLDKDPVLGLEWNRNLALELAKKLEKQRTWEDQDCDVKGLPFLDVVPDAGYEVDDLPALVHLMVVLHPGKVYLASLNIQEKNSSGTGPVDYQPPVVFLPWIGKDGAIRLALFNGTKQVSVESWLAQTSTRNGRRSDHIHLVELPLPPDEIVFSVPQP